MKYDESASCFQFVQSSSRILNSFWIHRNAFSRSLVLVLRIVLAENGTPLWSYRAFFSDCSWASNNLNQLMRHWKAVIESTKRRTGQNECWPPSAGVSVDLKISSRSSEGKKYKDEDEEQRTDTEGATLPFTFVVAAEASAPMHRPTASDTLRKRPIVVYSLTLGTSLRSVLLRRKKIVSDASIMLWTLPFEVGGD